MLSVETLEKDLKAKLNMLPREGCGAGELSNESAKSQPINIPIFTPAMLETSSYSSVPTTALVGSFLGKSESFCEANNVSFPLVSY